MNATLNQDRKGQIASSNVSRTYDVRIRRQSFFDALILPFLLCLPFVANAASYSVTPLKLRPGDQYGGASGINDSGLIVGGTLATPFLSTASVWDQFGDRTSLPTLPNGSSSYAAAVNRDGIAVGFSTNTAETGETTSRNTSAVKWASGELFTLPPLAGDTGANVALSINTIGEIVGVSADQATLWKPSGPQSLGMGLHSLATGINDAGQIVGSSSEGAFFWENDTATIIGKAPGTNVANGINQFGAVVGTIGNEAFYWQGGELTFLGKFPDPNPNNLSIAEDVNDRGEVIGNGINGRSFYWTKSTGMLDLQDLIDPEWQLRGVEEINNLGWITGRGLNSVLGDLPIVLKPVPLPSPIWMLGSALIAVRCINPRYRKGSINGCRTSA